MNPHACPGADELEERLEIFDEDGNPRGLGPRSRAHREGLWHRAANVFLFRPDGELLIQRRQSTKDVWPGAWDVSAAEHLHPGETFEQGAIRGLKEELGVTGVALEPIGDVARSRLDDEASGIRDYEFQQSFITTYAGPVSPDPNEVLEARTISLAELAAAFRTSPGEYTPWFRQRVDTLNLFELCNRF